MVMHVMCLALEKAMTLKVLVLVGAMPCRECVPRSMNIVKSMLLK